MIEEIEVSYECEYSRTSMQFRIVVCADSSSKMQCNALSAISRAILEIASKRKR